MTASQIRAAPALNVYYQRDVEAELITGRRVAVLGYGAQGRAQARNLNDAGVAVTVGLRPGSASAARVDADGLGWAPVEDAVAGADLVAFLIPDEVQPAVWRAAVEPNLVRGGVLVFAHGFNIHYGQIQPRPDLDVILAAPKGTGTQVRAGYEAGAGVAALIAAHQDASGSARRTALAYAGVAFGSGRTGILETTFRDETETDLFGEQAVLCGGMGALVKAAFEMLVEAGYPAELAYFECLHELKFIVDLLHTGGFERMHEVISDTAAFGAATRGPRVMDAHVRQTMAGILDDVRAGRFAEEFLADARAGAPVLRQARALERKHLIERVGRRLRDMMPWLS